MRTFPKTGQLQIRVTRTQKTAIRLAAKRAGLDMSSYVLARVLPAARDEFQSLVAESTAPGSRSFGFAELTSFLQRLTGAELGLAVADRPSASVDECTANYVAALVETACDRRGIPVPGWVASIAPLDEPFFGSRLETLRLHLLTRSPPAFRARNIFIDSTVGDRV